MQYWELLFAQLGGGLKQSSFRCTWLQTFFRNMVPANSNNLIGFRCVSTISGYLCPWNHSKTKRFQRLWNGNIGQRNRLELIKYYCVKNVQIRSNFWSVFSRTRISPYSVRIRENTNQKLLRIWKLHAVY